MNESAVNLFAGPGGSCLGALLCGYDPLGIEVDAAACDTRRAAGLRTLEADITGLDPLQFCGIDLLMASAPCPSFSYANAGRDGADIEKIIEAIRRGGGNDPLIDFADERSALTLLAFEWAMAIQPKFIAFEQVPGVLPIWKETLVALAGVGYLGWCGVLEAERYGVPQTRERAILIASREGVVHPPEPTHHRYVPKAGNAPEPSLFGDDLLPWVSMAEALGWGMTERPALTVPSTSGDGGGRPMDGGSGARIVLKRERENGKWKLRAGNQDNATEREADEPAPTVAFGHASSSHEWVVNTGRDWKAGEGREAAQSRPVDEPSPTITGAGRMPWQWQLADIGNTRSGTREQGRERRGDEPAPTVTSRGDQLERQELKAEDWPSRRPATTIAADSRVFQPGSRRADDGRVNLEGDDRSANTIRVEPWEAGVLQSFPANYPWQGTRTAQFRQVGNAWPPLMAAAAIRAVLATAERSTDGSE